MIFIERPITAQHVREVCARFNEGLRVEYKRDFDASVRDKLPKVISSFANSRGGVLVVGVNAVNGVPQLPFDGFVPQPREEYPLTVENICLQGIHLPVLPRTQVVQSDVAGRVFLVIEVDESSEAPHAIENSKMVYVRTGNAANPYDLAKVDLIIDLLKRRREPLELRDRLLTLANHRSRQVVPVEYVNRPFALISISPAFPRSPLCTSQQTWDFLRATMLKMTSLVPLNSVRRVPDGAASVTHANPPQVQGQYVELGRYGLAFAAKEFAVTPWQVGTAGTVWEKDEYKQLSFEGLLQTLLRLTSCAEQFYSAFGYQGNIVLSISLHHVLRRAMRFVHAPDGFPDDPEDFRCLFSNGVSAEQFLTVERLRQKKIDVLTEVLSDITWAFWQSNDNLPVDRLKEIVAIMTQRGI